MALASENSIVNGIFRARKLFAKSESSVTKEIALVCIGSILLAISAQYKVPLWPVPITLQSLVVMLLGTLYGWRLGAITIVAYWAEGIAIGGLCSHIPGFANGSGLLYFTGSPSAGFLWGFLPMVLIIGFLNDKFNWRESKITVLMSLVLGQSALYFVGLSHAFWIILPEVDWMSNGNEMLNIYLYPFLIGDTIKTLIAGVITIKAVRMAKKF